MAGQEDSESKRLLKPGDFGLRVALRPNGFFDASDRILYKPPTTNNNPSSYPPTRSLTSPEPPSTHFYHRSEPHNFVDFPSQAKDISQQLESSVSNLVAEKRFVFKSESETTLSSLYSRQRSMQSVSQPFELSNPSSPESEDCLTFRTATDRDRRAHSIYPCNTASTQTERSPFEEKFLFRESILLGCDLVAELTEKLPSLGGLREHAQFIREKTIQSRAQNICSRLVHKAKEPQIIAEYVKTFFRIADSWLDVRNCFGTSDQCSNVTCSLDTKDLTNNYVEWMYVSRQLLNSIVKGLETVTKGKVMDCPSNWVFGEASQTSRTVGAKGSEQMIWQPPNRSTSDASGAGGNWGYPPNPACYCGPTNLPPSEEIQPRILPRNYPPNEPPPRFQSQPPPMYPNHPRMYPVNDTIDANDEYLKPSSYDVPRTNMPTSQKRHNISKAKSTCFQDKAANKGYVIALLSSGNKRDDNFDGKDCNEMSESEDMPPKFVEAETEPVDEWMLPLLKDGGKDDVEGDGEGCLDSDSQGSAKDQKSDVNDNETASCNQSSRTQKPPKNSTRLVKRRLTHNELVLLQALVQDLWKCDTPEHMKHPVKNSQQYYKVVRHPIFLETITNKLKNGIYETLEQFVHDGRRLISNTFSFCQKESLDLEKASNFENKFESLLERSFERYASWTHITGDSKEVNCYPELKSSATRKRTKLPKILQPTDAKQ